MSGPYLYHSFKVPNVNQMNIKMCEIIYIYAAAKDFGSYLVHSCGPKINHMPRKLRKQALECASHK